MINTMPVLTVWYGSMPETNGKSNWTAILHRKGECISTGVTIDRSEYPDRVRYEADRMRYVIGELDKKPSILSYDGNKHSGYTPPSPTVTAQKLIELTSEQKKAIAHSAHFKCQQIRGSFYNAAEFAIEDVLRLSGVAK
jgi:hypothetical protein